MKHEIYAAFIALLLLASCQSDSSKISLEEMAADSAAMADQNKTLVVPWEATLNDSTHMMEIKRNPAANMTNLSNLDIVDALNYKYPQIKLKWVKQEGNKAFVKIQDADFLTRESGTEGARAYLAEVTFSLTELKGITEVDFSFKEGDHARPGVYKREDFKGFN
jgi:hypothetical protein